MKKISVIVPVHNVEKYIKNSFESLEKQTIFDKLKIIIIDDFSTDNSYKFCIDFSDKYPNNVLLLKNEKNMGVSKTRNRGLEFVDTKYVAFLDADDKINNNFYEKLLFLSERYNTDISILNIALVRNNKLIERNKRTKELLIFNQNESKEYLFRNKYIDNSPTNKLFKMNLLQNIRFDTDLKIAEDFKFVYDCIKVSNIIVADYSQIDYYYIQRENSAMNKEFNDSFFDIITVLDYIIANEKSNNKFQIKLLECRYLSEKALLLKRMISSENSSKKYNDLIEEYYKDVRKINFYYLLKYFYNFKGKINILIACLYPKLFKIKLKL